MVIQLPDNPTEHDILLLLVTESNRHGSILERIMAVEVGCPLSQPDVGKELLKRVDRTWLVALAAVVIGLANLSPAVLSNLGPLLKLLIH